MLGYRAAVDYYRQYIKGGRVQHWYTGAICNGNESQINNCPNRGRLVKSYAYPEQFGVICENDTDFPTGNVRLNGGSSPSEGRIEMQIHGVWGGIITIVSMRTADVFCRMLGYKGALTYKWIGDDSVSSPKWNKVFECNGDETNISQCNVTMYVEFPSTNAVACHSYPDDVQVRLVGGSAPYYGKIEVKFNNTWGSICHMDDANAICRMMNYTRALVTLESFRGAPHDKKWLSGLYCSGKETSLEQCDRPGWGDDVGTLYCPIDTKWTGGVICDDPSVKYPNVTVRLVDEDVPNKGRVEVRYYGVWGSVTVGRWSRRNNVHHVICRMLGFNRGLTYRQVHTNGKGPTLLSNLDCTGNEASIEQCSHLGWGETLGGGDDMLEVHCENEKSGFVINLI
ncbi:hypothetical protein QZH41_020474 [Actinostola sp. cb2023]|nr:hypothetical protein QZH41_020474 [Actinostola sp. cb2023]